MHQFLQTVLTQPILWLLDLSVFLQRTDMKRKLKPVVLAVVTKQRNF